MLDLNFIYYCFNFFCFKFCFLYSLVLSFLIFNKLNNCYHKHQCHMFDKIIFIKYKSTMILILIIGCMMQLCSKNLPQTDTHEIGESPTIRLQPSNSYRSYNITDGRYCLEKLYLIN